MILTSYLYSHPSEKNRYLKVVRVFTLACSHVWYIQGRSDIEKSEQDEKPFNASLTRSNPNVEVIWYHKTVTSRLHGWVSSRGSDGGSWLSAFIWQHGGALDWKRSIFHRKLVLSMMLGGDLAGLRALSPLGLAFKVSWFPLMAASKRDLKWGDDATRDLPNNRSTANQLIPIVWMKHLNKGGA